MFRISAGEKTGRYLYVARRITNGKKQAMTMSEVRRNRMPEKLMLSYFQVKTRLFEKQGFFSVKKYKES